MYLKLTKRYIYTELLRKYTGIYESAKILNLKQTRNF